MTSPIGSLSNFTQAVPRVQDGPRSITIPVLPGSGSAGAAGDVGPSFKDTFTRAMNQVTDARDNAADLATRFAAGEQVELHAVMASSEEAGIALDLAIEMRNKVVEAYRALINMQS